MKYRLLITTFFVLSIVGAFAGTRTKEEMKEAAMSVLMKSSAARGTTKSNLSTDLKEYLTKEKLSIIGSEELGFAVVTSDDRFDEVIGYSTTSFTDSMPCGFKWWLERVEKVMENVNVLTAATRAYGLSVNGSVNPMLTTEWGQDNPFNAQLKYSIGGNNYQFVTGCVATAMAQVMKFYEYPEKSQGSIQYIVQNYNARMSHTFGDTYDWNNMLDKYNYQVWGNLDAQAKAVSVLMRDCGMAVEMNYGTKASGAQSSKIASGMINYFSYDSNGTKYYKRSDYQKDTWMQMIYNELKAGRPIIYNGTDKTETNNSIGHSFVLHGFDSTGRVYINWGWKGYHDGYFDIDMLNPDEHTYNSDQDMVFVNPGKSSVIEEKCKVKVTSSVGGVVYVGDTNNQVTGATQTFEVGKGASITLTFSPQTGYKLKTVKLNNADITANINNSKYTINNIINTIIIDVEFEKDTSTYSSDYNIYITCIASSSSTTIVGSNVTKKIGFSITNSGTKDINISKLVAKNPDTNVTIFTSTDTSVLGKLNKNSNKTLSLTTNTDIMPVFELEYNIGDKEYYYDANQYRILTISANDYGMVSFADVQIGTDSKKFSIGIGGTAVIKLIPDEGCSLSKLLLNSSDVTSIVSNNQYTISNITTNTSVNATFDDISGERPSVDGHEYVDLGLKSGKCWSTMNYGAKKIEEAGYYSSSSSINWGTHWRVPTKEEFQELIDQCEWTWTDRKGVNGYSVKGPNGNTMFLPAAGYKDHLSSFLSDGYVNKGSVVYCRTSSMTTDLISSSIIFKATQSQMGLTNLSPADYDEYPIRPISTIIKEPEVINSLPGDVNNDGSVSVTDVGCVINYILEMPPSTFIFAAADMNKDNEISVTDVGYIINYILNEGATSRVAGNVQEKYDSQPTLMAVADGYELAMNGLESFIGFQFDIQLTDGSLLNGVQLANASSDHVLTFRQLGDGKYRVVCYSPTNSCFNTGRNSLVSILTKGDVNISNIRFTTLSMDEVRFDELHSSTTGLSAMGQNIESYVQGNTLYVRSDSDTVLKLYNINGSLYRTFEIRKGVNTYEDLNAGVYLINNLKIIVR